MTTRRRGTRYQGLVGFDAPAPGSSTTSGRQKARWLTTQTSDAALSHPILEVVGFVPTAAEHPLEEAHPDVEC